MQIGILNITRYKRTRLLLFSISLYLKLYYYILLPGMMNDCNPNTDSDNGVTNPIEIQRKFFKKHF